MARKQPKPIQQLTFAQFEEMFPDEDACCAYLVGRRWPEGVRCPRCGMEVGPQVSTLKWHWQCKNCAPQTTYRFSHIAGTIFENTNKPLRDWFRVVHMMLTSKKGMSALQIKRVMGFGSYETAWSMCHKIRVALMEDIEKLGGIVEVDETSSAAKQKTSTGISAAPAELAVSAPVKLQSSAQSAVARVIADLKASTLQSFVREAVSHKVSLLCTDQWAGYKQLGKEFPHGVVDHSKGQYVIGAIHTNTIERFWSIFKRGVIGTFHKMSAKYMPLYVAEFQFRYNNRDNADIFGTAITGC